MSLIVFLLIILGITSSESMLERVRIDIPDITFSKAIASFYISQLPFGIILIFGNVAFFYILFFIIKYIGNYHYSNSSIIINKKIVLNNSNHDLSKPSLSKMTTPMAILVSGVLIAVVLFLKDDAPEGKAKEGVAEQWYELNCKYYQGNDVNTQNKILNIRYKTGIGYEQRFYIGPFGLEDVTTRKGYAYGKKCAAKGSCNQRVAEYTFNEVYRTLNIEVRDYSDRYIYQYICDTK